MILLNDNSGNATNKDTSSNKKNGIKSETQYHGGTGGGYTRPKAPSVGADYAEYKAPAAPNYADPSADAAYLEALGRLRVAEGSLPGYKGSYAADLESLYTRITGRDDFSYDVNSDPVYQQYRQLYTRNGALAMQDTMGQAAALTGGYGSSYSQAVGQQQYNAYMQQLNDVVPTLYQQAYSRWLDAGDELYRQYDLTRSLANDEYGRYRDAMGDYWQGVDYLRRDADAAYSRAKDERDWQYLLNSDAADARSDARAALMQSVLMGHVPTAAEASAAGVGRSELNAWLKYAHNKGTY